MRLHRLVWVYTCQNVKLLEISCRGSWASAWDFQQCGMCDQQSLRSACPYAQTDQSLCQSLEYSMVVKLLTEHHLESLSLTGGCTGSSECTLVKMWNCWKSHAAAHNILRLISNVRYVNQEAILEISEQSQKPQCHQVLLLVFTPGRRQSKTSILSTNVDKKSLETEFLIVICRLTGDKWQSETLFLSIFDPLLSIVKSVFRLPPTRCVLFVCILFLLAFRFWVDFFFIFIFYNFFRDHCVQLRSAVGSKPDCRYRNCEFDPSPVPFFSGDWSWNNLYGHSPLFRRFKKGCCYFQAKVCAQSTGLLLGQTCPGKKVRLGELTVSTWPCCWLGRKTSNKVKNQDIWKHGQQSSYGLSRWCQKAKFSFSGWFVLFDSLCPSLGLPGLNQYYKH